MCSGRKEEPGKSSLSSGFRPSTALYLKEDAQSLELCGAPPSSGLAVVSAVPTKRKINDKIPVSLLSFFRHKSWIGWHCIVYGDCYSSDAGLMMPIACIESNGVTFRIQLALAGAAPHRRNPDHPRNSYLDTNHNTLQYMH